jgi:hypothetical protein
MDSLTVGSNVTLKVKNVFWPDRHLWATNAVGPEYRMYSGVVVREKWFDADEIGITSDSLNIPFRRIKRHNIVEVNNSPVEYVIPAVEKRIEMRVSGSKGAVYTVVKENGKAHCTCPGFGFRRTCKHIQEVI